MAAAVPIGAAGEKFLKFDTFSCILRHFFANFSSAIFDNKTGLNYDLLIDDLFYSINYTTSNSSKISFRCSIRFVELRKWEANLKTIDSMSNGRLSYSFTRHTKCPLVTFFATFDR